MEVNKTMCRTIKLLLLYAVLLCAFGTACSPYSTINKPIRVTDDNNNLTNAILPASDATVWMGTYNYELYFCSSKGKYKGWLCKVGEDGIQKVLKLNSGRIFYGCVDSYIYFYPSSKGECSVACYDFSSNNIVCTYEGECNVFLPVWIEGQSIYIPLGFDDCQLTPEYVHIKGRDVVETTTQIDGESIGNMVFYSPIETESESISNFDRAMISTDYGTVIHQQGIGHMLYLINKENQVVSLFDVPCLDARSAITIVDDTVYLSFLRYEKYGEIGMKRFENDTMEGTYRISLKDYSVEKLNDNIYDGLYYFGDAYIYACSRDGRIYCLNLDGSVKDILYR